MTRRKDASAVVNSFADLVDQIYNGTTQFSRHFDFGVSRVSNWKSGTKIPEGEALTIWFDAKKRVPDLKPSILGLPMELSEAA